MTKEQILAGVKSLSKQERIDLVMDLWDSIEADDVPLTEAQKQELDRRIAEDAADSDSGEEWESLRTKLLRRTASGSLPAVLLKCVDLTDVKGRQSMDVGWELHHGGSPHVSRRAVVH